MSQQEIQTDDLVRGAIRTLRGRLGLNQVEFSLRLGVSYGAIQKYEQKRSPRGDALKPFISVAEAAGHFDLAAIFEAAVLSNFAGDAVTELVLFIAAKQIFQSRPEVLMAAAVAMRPKWIENPVAVLLMSAYLLPEAESFALRDQALSHLRERVKTSGWEDPGVLGESRNAILAELMKGAEVEDEETGAR